MRLCVGGTGTKEKRKTQMRKEGKTLAVASFAVQRKKQEKKRNKDKCRRVREKRGGTKQGKTGGCTQRGKRREIG